MPHGMMQIGEVAERVGLSLNTIRHYDQAGLVTPSLRSPGGFRLYSEDDLAALLVVKRMKPLGFSLEEMRELLDSLEALEHPESVAEPDRRARLVARVGEFEAAAQARVQRLRTELAHAEEYAGRIAERLARARERGLAGEAADTVA